MATYNCRVHQTFPMDVSDDLLAELHGDLIADGWADGSESACDVVRLALEKEYFDIQGMGKLNVEVC